MPLTYATFLIASLALSGIPLTSGFLSKDGILAGTFAFASITGHWLFPIAGFLVAMMTAFYMFRLIILTFHGEPKNKEKYEHAHESKFAMVLPLVILSALSVFFWYTPNPINAEQGWFLSKWIKVPEISVPESSRYSFMQTEAADVEAGKVDVLKEEVIYSDTYTEAVHDAHIPAMILSLLVALSGIFIAFLIYYWKKVNPDKIASAVKPLYKLSYNKWYFDEIYDKTFVAGTLAFSRILAWFDLKVIDGIVDGSASITKLISKISGWIDNYIVDGFVNFTAYLSGSIGSGFRKFQTGRVQTYVVLVIFSLVILLLLFKTL
jgi:NADH-quinone oxidoreductase subunit L